MSDYNKKMPNYNKMSVFKLTDLLIDLTQKGDKKQVETILNSLGHFKKVFILSNIVKKCNKLK